MSFGGGATAGALVFGGQGTDGGGESGAVPVRRLSAVPARTPGQDASDVLSALVVEDDPSMRLLITVNLELDGFRVVAAATGGQALDLAASEEPDVVLLDVMLPDVGGFEVAERLSGMPVVFMSARTSESDIERGREVGAIDYVTKPFDPNALPGRLREDLEALARGGVAGVWELRFGREG